MTLFTIDNDGRFSEFNENKLEHEGRNLDLVSLLSKNPSSVFKDNNIMLIGQNIPTDTEDTIDLMGADRYGNSVLIDIENKKASRKTLFRLLEKAAYVDSLDYNDLNAIFHEFAKDKLGKAHEAFFNLSAVTVDWNLHCKMVIASQKIMPELLKVADYLRDKGMDITCVEFKSVTYGDNIQMVSREIVLGGETAEMPAERAVDYVIPESDKDKFFHALDENGRLVFSKLFDFATQEGLAFKWTSQGFSLNVMLDGEAIGLCYGYSPESLLSQSIYTGFDQISRKVNNADEIVHEFQAGIEQTGFFNKTRSSYRWDINEFYTVEEVNGFFGLLKKVAEKIKDNGLIGIESGTQPLEV